MGKAVPYLAFCRAAFCRAAFCRAAFCAAAFCAAGLLPAQTLRIYAIDVEGGKSTLYVAPSGESMLIDAGYAGNGGRDAGRIAAAAAQAGVRRIDYLVVTHFHSDHVGGVPAIAARLPVGRIFDHGESVEKSKPGTDFTDYATLREKSRHTILRAGDTIPVKGLHVEVVAADGKVIGKPLAAGGQANPLCAGYEPLPPDSGENARSLALMITFGKLRISDLGDLFWNQEHELACPSNKLGTVDLYMTTHHGTATSGSPQIVHALHPKVAIMNNGAVKGGSAKALTTLHSSPGLEDLWQLHYSVEGGKAGAGKDLNTREAFIANPSTDNDRGFALEITGLADGSFTVRNDRSTFEKTYRK
jgi:competence protein ComEC